jgi:carboxypeptidase Taq
VEQALGRLHELDREVQTLSNVASVLHWDQETYMPAEAIGERAEQLALLEGLIHDRRTSPEIGDHLAALGVSPEGAGDPEGAGEQQPLGARPEGGRPERSDYEPLERPDGGEPEANGLPDTEHAFLRELGRVYRRATRLPRRLVTDLARQTAIGQQVWAEAREKADFSLFSGQLRTIVSLVRETAECLGYEEHPYDPLLDEYEPWMKTARVEEVFHELRTGLKRLLDAIRDSGARVDAAFLRRKYPLDRQRQLSLQVLQRIGYDFLRGRLDESAHPFTTRLGSSDVRLTTRFNEHNLATGIFGTIHECGHGLYELGLDPVLRGTLLADGASLGIHESQSRTWENLIGRSRPFWRHFYPSLEALFPADLAGVGPEGFYRGINAVRPSLIRVEADEVTYNLHIILRFELEKAVIKGELDVGDLVEAWNARSQDLLGIVPPDDAQGVLQDIHWSGGAFGYFPTYALGNLYAAQFFAALRRDIPELDALLAAGSFGEILDWQRRSIHRHGRLMPASRLCRRISGEPLSAAHLLSYLQDKFGEIYGL